MSGAGPDAMSGDIGGDCLADPTSMKERLAHLEGRLDSFGVRFNSLERRFDSVDRRFELLDQRCQSIARRCEVMAHAYDKPDGRIDPKCGELCACIDEPSRKLDALGERMERHFQWKIAVLLGLWGPLVVAVVLRSA